MVRRVVLVACLCGTALAQPRKEAAEHFERATTAEKEGRFKDAIDEYEQAYALVPHADVLYNIARNYEAMQSWQRAADYYQRYLDESSEPPPDVDAVKKKLAVLRAKARNAEPPETRDAKATELPVTEVHPPSEPIRPVDLSVVQLPPPSPSRWHAGASYGIGFGDAPVERYLGHAGMRFGRVFDLDAIVGGFGKNDVALGAQGRLVLFRSGLIAPFVKGGVSIGVARQDASKEAGTRFPLGFEAGGGLEIGARGRVEVGVVARWITGGWTEDTTTADSYVNDTFMVGFDLGVTFDFAIISAGR
jgi:hypothetical protein